MSDTRKNLDGAEPMLYLEIVRGSTRFPHRPVYEGVFLIGAGSNCDLRIGGEETPAVHSIVRAEADDVHIECLSRRPVLRVNGNPVERSPLSDGDTIQIGAIQMVARFQLTPTVGAMSQPAPEDLQTLSAEQLIDLLEEDLTLVEQDEAARQSGAELLLDAAMKAAIVPADEADDESPLRVLDPDEELHDEHAEAEQLIVALNRIADDLNLRVDRLRKKEEIYSEAAEELLEMQNRFSRLLERVLERLDRRDEHRRSA